MKCGDDDAHRPYMVNSTANGETDPAFAEGARHPQLVQVGVHELDTQNDMAIQFIFKAGALQ